MYVCVLCVECVGVAALPVPLYVCVCVCVLLVRRLLSTDCLYVRTCISIYTRTTTSIRRAILLSSQRHFLCCFFFFVITYIFIFRFVSYSICCQYGVYGPSLYIIIYRDMYEQRYLYECDKSIAHAYMHE